jgi:hypothetical protein
MFWEVLNIYILLPSLLLGGQPGRKEPRHVCESVCSLPVMTRNEIEFY